MTPEFTPVFLGNGINAYSMARAFHEAYGVRSVMASRSLSALDTTSVIWDCILEPELDEPETFLATMDRISSEYGKNKLLLIGCADHYVRLIVTYRDKLEDKFIVTYPGQDAMDKMVLKEDFYALCDKYGLDYAATFIHTPETGYDYELGFDFPVVLKPSDSVKYNKHPFEGFHKVFFIDNREELDETLKKIYAAGYDDHMVIQDMVPGEDTSIYDLHAYVGTDHKVKMMNMGNVVLEEHGPTTVGNNAATIVAPNMEVMEKVTALLEGIGWEGACDGDIKYDARDGKYKMFEINIRQGRSNYRITGGGDNLAELYVRDYILREDIPGPKYVTEPYFWHVVPMGIVNKYVKDKAILKQIKELVKQGKVCDSLDYSKDRKLKRLVYLKLRDINLFRKYKMYMK